MAGEERTANDEARYWNEEGGERWVRYIDRLEPMLEKFSRHLVAAVAAQPGERVLDIGCGGGPTSAAYAAAVGEHGAVLGVDISAVILELARQRFGQFNNLRFETGDAASYPFTGPGFDIVTSRFGIMFFPDPPAAFAHLATAARPGARFRFMCWRGLGDNPWMGAPARAAFSVIPAPEKPAPGTPGPFSLADPERIRELLEGAGLTDLVLHEIDEPIALGTVDEALDWLTHMGPAAKPLADANAAQFDAARAAMREVLEAHHGADGVVFDGAAWLVEASRP